MRIKSSPPLTTSASITEEPSVSKNPYKDLRIRIPEIPTRELQLIRTLDELAIAEHQQEREIKELRARYFPLDLEALGLKSPDTDEEVKENNS